MRLDPLGHEFTNNGFRSWSHHHGLAEFLATGVSHNGEFRTKALDVFGFTTQVTLGNKEREVGVLGSGDLDSSVNLGLNVFPNGVTVGTNDHGAANRAVVGHFGLGYDVLVPTGKVLVLRGQYAWLCHGAPSK